MKMYILSGQLTVFIRLTCIFAMISRTLTLQLQGLCRQESERLAIEDLMVAFENAEQEMPGITRHFVKGLSERLNG